MQLKDHLSASQLAVLHLTVAQLASCHAVACISEPPFIAVSAYPQGGLDFLRHLSGGHEKIAYAVGKKPCVYTDVACF